MKENPKRYTFRLYHFLSLAIAIIVMLLTACQKSATSPKIETFEIKGADLSLLPEIRKHNARVQNQLGATKDMLEILKEAGVNTIRLRLWHSPQENYASFEEVKKLSNEAQSNGLKVIISIHFSDTWADPGQQTLPALWESLGTDPLADSVQAYCQKIAANIRADYLQIGNEINHGFLWPHGHIDNRSKFTKLFNIGAKAIKEASPNSKIVLHLAGTQNVSWFLNEFDLLQYDLLGISYYPWWHGKNLDHFESQLIEYQKTSGKPVFIAETAYPFSLEWKDWTHNIIGLESQLIPGISATPQGQLDFVSSIVERCSNHEGIIGFCYWGGEWISYKGPQATNGSPWENLAFWDFNGNPLPILKVFDTK